MTAINPFIPHNKKELGRQALMKLKKSKGSNTPAPAAIPSLSNMVASVNDMKDAMRKLSQSMSKYSRRELLAAALQTFPMAVCLPNPDSSEPFSYMDSVNYEFRVGELLLLWDEFPIPQWIEYRHNEAEKEDFVAILDYLIHMNPDTVMTIGLFVNHIKEHFEKMYPAPKVEPFSSFNGFTMEQKDYFLPALKVLNRDGHGVFWSPVYVVEWKNDELSAEHIRSDYVFSFASTPRHVQTGKMEEIMETCDCGIYASVNLTELQQYVGMSDNKANSFGMDNRFDKKARKLCIIEPLSDATVWLASKGWKTDHAFVSEIVGETISPQDAATLLSMVWQRPLDVVSLYNSKESQ